MAEPLRRPPTRQQAAFNRSRRRAPDLFRDGEAAEVALEHLGRHEPSAESVVGRLRELSQHWATTGSD